MTPNELKIIKQIAEDSATCRQLLETHTAQIALLFEENRQHADKITVVQTKQDMCQKRNDPGTRTERAGLLAAIIFGITSLVWQIVNLFK